MSEQKPEPRRLHRPSFIWPVILITIGIVILLNNLGMVEGDFWTIVWQWWPVLLVAIGLDSLFRRNEITGPVFLIGLAMVILANNLGFIGWGTWNILWRLWPILLVAVGLEIIIGRRSLWVSILVVLLIVGALGGVLWTYGMNTPGGAVLGTTTVDQTLGEIESAEIEINPTAGNLIVDHMTDSTALVKGKVGLEGRSKVYTDYHVQGEIGYFKIDSRLVNNVPSFSTWNWDLGLTERIPIQLVVSMGAGDMELNLAGLNISGLEVSQGVGDITLILQDSGSYDVRVQQAIGSITITLPKSIGVRIEVDRAITNLDIPLGYQHEGDYYYSPEYESSDYKVNLKISQAIGNIEIRY